MTKEQTHHIRRVMRMQQGDVIRVADNSGRVLLVEVEYHQEEAAARVVREVRDRSRTSVELILAQGMIKGEKWDYLLQKSAELGVAEIIPFVSSRCVVKIKDEKSEKKIVRWNKILCELRAHPSPKRVLMVVGSEGGFSADEVEALTASGFHRVSLGGRILRAETAAISLLNSIEFYYDMAGEKDEDDI